MAKRKLSIKEFQRSLQEYIANLRQTIEAECLGFDVNPQATQARRAAVCDPVTGYDYFVENYFPHYVRKACRERISLRFPREKLSTRTIAKVESELYDVLIKLEEAEILENVEANKAKLRVQRNGKDANRLDCVVPADVVTGAVCTAVI